jgi:hypothetical protein
MEMPFAGLVVLSAGKGSFDCGCSSLSRSTILAQDDRVRSACREQEMSFTIWTL